MRLVMLLASCHISMAEPGRYAEAVAEVDLLKLDCNQAKTSVRQKPPAYCVQGLMSLFMTCFRLPDLGAGGCCFRIAGPGGKGAFELEISMKISGFLIKVQFVFGN